MFLSGKTDLEPEELAMKVSDEIVTRWNETHRNDEKDLRKK